MQLQFYFTSHWLDAYLIGVCGMKPIAFKFAHLPQKYVLITNSYVWELLDSWLQFN